MNIPSTVKCLLPLFQQRQDMFIFTSATSANKCLAKSYSCINPNHKRKCIICNNNNNIAFFPQASWGRLEMKPERNKLQMHNLQTLKMHTSWNHFYLIRYFYCKLFSAIQTIAYLKYSNFNFHIGISLVSFVQMLLGYFQ